MSLTQGVLVYRNTFVYSSLSELPSIETNHTMVSTIFAEKEVHFTRNGGLIELMRYKVNVESFYKTVSSINGTEI